MNTTEKILNELKQLRQRYPDLRVGEILQVAVDQAKAKPNTDLTDLSDKALLTGLQSFARTAHERRSKRGRLARLDKNKARIGGG